MNKSDLLKFYNIHKILKAKDLAKLSKTYKDNLQEIIVMFKKKPTTPNDKMPTWFKTWNKQVFSKILNKLKDMKTRISNLVEKNNLVE